MKTRIIHYVVYDHPLDYPDEYVVREFHIQGGNVQAKDIIFKETDLSKIRKHLQNLGATPLNIDDPNPVILETWMY